jgi:hypothetical protein
MLRFMNYWNFCGEKCHLLENFLLRQNEGHNDVEAMKQDKNVIFLESN